jgi:ABC-type nitrate/sulfonate/bicarbonate transport system ATPase subunit
MRYSRPFVPVFVSLVGSSIFRAVRELRDHFGTAACLSRSCKRVRIPGQRTDTPVKFYSSDMYVRLAFAVAAHLEPEILIVDEMLAVGDAKFHDKCIAKMHEVSSGWGRTVLLASHDVGAISALCDCIIVGPDWLNRGPGTRGGQGRGVKLDHPIWFSNAGDVQSILATKRSHRHRAGFIEPSPTT